MKKINQLKSGETDRYALAYAYATYLSATRSIEPGEAIPMISDLISMGFPTEARYCIDNLKRNGIQSYDLLALRGLCYQHELQPELAVMDLESAMKGDPGNEKIRILLNNARSGQSPGKDHPMQEALFLKGLDCLQREQFDSALYFISETQGMEKQVQYQRYVEQITKVVAGEKLIASDPSDFRGYMQKSQGLSGVNLFDLAQKALDSGLEVNPDNLNLILAKALVWVQAGDRETARQYLWEQEQRGISIDPAIKQQILQPQN